MLCKCLIFKVIRLGFEPKTHSLEGCCSIQLSYRTLYLVARTPSIVDRTLYLVARTPSFVVRTPSINHSDLS